MSILNIAKKIINPLTQPITSKIGKFHNLHKGETCYLIAGGISIKYFDLGAFDNHISLAMNHVPFHKDFSKLDARYCFLIEPYWFFPFLRTTEPPIKYIRNRQQEAYRKVIKNNPDKNFFLNLSNYPVTFGQNINYLFKELPGSNIVEYFMSRGINPFHGTLRNSILMAIYFGFSHAFLVGYDKTHKGCSTYHWFEKGYGDRIPHEGYESDFFNIAKEFIDLTTVTVDGKSDMMNYIKYQDLTGRLPIYKENNEILDEKSMRVIASRPCYRVF